MADKSKTIKNATDKELDELLVRLEKENRLQNLIGDLKRKSSPGGYLPYDRPEVSAEAPIDSLYHYGVIGMKWGRRRFGLTAKRQIEYDKKALEKLDKGGHLSVGLTKKRQAAYDERDRKALEKSIEKNTKKVNKSEDKKKREDELLSEDHKKKTKMRTKNVSQMSNAELKELNNRLQLEKQYKDLTKSEVSAGQKFAKDLLKEVGREVVKEILKDSVKKGIKKAVKR